MVAAVATEEPETAANSVQAPTLAWAMPPGTRPIRRSKATNISVAMPERTSSPPISTNIGRAVREKDSTEVSARSAMVAGSGKGSRA